MCAPMNTERPLNVGARMPEAREDEEGGAGGDNGKALDIPHRQNNRLQVHKAAVE